MSLEKIIEKQLAERHKQPPGYDKALRIVGEVLKKNAGTKDQRNAILRVVKQCELDVCDTKTEANVAKALQAILRK